MWSPSDLTDRVYFLERGQITVHTPNSRQGDVIVQVVNPPEPFGELCFCSAHGGVRDSRAKAVLESTALEVSYMQFLGYLQENPRALGSLAMSLCIRVSDLQRRIEVLAHRGAGQRLGLLLVAVIRERPAGDRADEVTLGLSHDDLARMAAMSRPHVTVTMGSFRRRGLVRYGRGQPLTVDVRALETFLGRAAAKAD